MEKVRIYLSDQQVEKIFYSPLLRCRRSAEIISGSTIPLIENDLLKEIHMGAWEQLSFDEIKIKYPREYLLRGLDFGGFIPPNGESFSMCLERSKKAFLDIAAHSPGDVAIVAHAGINRVIICWLSNMNLNDIFSIAQPYGCVNIIQENNGKFDVTQTGLIPFE